MIPGLPWQWAMTTRSARPASSTNALSSSSQNSWCTGWSLWLITAPEAQILITLAPSRSCMRTAFRHSGTPSHNVLRPLLSQLSTTELRGKA